MLVNKSNGFRPGTTTYSIVTNYEQREVCKVADYGRGLELGSAVCIPLVSIEDTYKWAMELIVALEQIAEREGIQL